MLFFTCHITTLLFFDSTESAKEEEGEDDDDMDGLQTDDEDDDGDGSDKEMGLDAEDGDEADSIRLKKLAAQVCTTSVYLLKLLFFFLLFIFNWSDAT